MALRRIVSCPFRNAVVLDSLYVILKQRRDLHNLKGEVNVGILDCFRLDQSDRLRNEIVVAIGIEGGKGGRIRSTGIKDVLALNVASKEVKHL